MKFLFDYEKNRGLGVIKSEYLDIIREHFSVADPIAHIKRKRFGGGYFPSRIYAITKGGRFHVGLLGEIISYIKSLSAEYKLIITDLLKNEFYAPYKSTEICELKLSPREYQRDAITKALEYGRGIIELGTGGGKTLIMATLINSIRKQSDSSHTTLVIVPGIQLVEQTYNDFIEYGFPILDVSKWSGNNPYKPTSIVIASSSILHSKTTNPKWYTDVDLVLLDECHKLKNATKLNKLFPRIKTKHKFGFTGTMPEDRLDCWNICGKLGSKLFKMTSNDLQKEAFVSKAKIKIVKLHYKRTPKFSRASIKDPTIAYNEESEFLHNNVYRNKVIASLANKVKNNMLILVDKIAHGEMLLSTIKSMAKDKDVYFIQGEVDVKIREEIRDYMESHDNVICIAISSIFSTGINIKNLHYVLFASAGKSKIKIIQAIGRGLRLNDNKNNVIIFDIADNLKYSNEHLNKRLSLYNQERITYGIKNIFE